MLDDDDDVDNNSELCALLTCLCLGLPAGATPLCAHNKRRTSYRCLQIELLQVNASGAPFFRWPNKLFAAIDSFCYLFLVALVKNELKFSQTLFWYRISLPLCTRVSFACFHVRKKCVRKIAHKFQQTSEQTNERANEWTNVAANERTIERANKWTNNANERP